MFRSQLSLCILLVCLLFSACKKNTGTNPKQDISFNDYAADWAEVNQLEKKGMGKAILNKTDLILEKALEENNINQIFKALAYHSKYSNNIEEESSLKIISQYEERITAADFPLKQLLHSATAELYFQYYNQYRWRYRQRTVVENFEATDIRSWDLDKILSVIRHHYLASLEPKQDLHQFPTASFKPILSIAPHSEEKSLDLSFRPTFYDFLADRALKYFQLNEGRVSAPINEFNIDKYEPFSSFEDFSKVNFSTTDTLANSFLQAKIYQDLILLHQKDKDPSVLIDFELGRLQHYHIVSNNPLRDSLYLRALTELSGRFPSSSARDEIDYQRARFYFQIGSTYNVQDTSKQNRWLIKKAHDICQSKVKGSTFGAKQCAALLQNIEMKSFSFITENTYLPKENMLFRFQYQNIDSIYFRIVKVPHQRETNRNFLSKEEFLSGLIERTTLRSWMVALPNPKDFQSHSIELPADPLPKGNYYLLASPNKNFDFKQDQIAHINFKMTELAYFSRQTEDGESVEVFVRNRQEGKGIEGAEITAYVNRYDYSSRMNTYRPIGQFKTDEEGYCKFSAEVNNQSLMFSIQTADDTLSSNSSFYLYSKDFKERTTIHNHLYTDRAIYRPGQIVYFKGISIETKGDAKQPKADYKNTVKLINVNGEILQSIPLTSNDYGSFNGSFILPSSGLNGRYRIQTQHGSHHFSVEEYKRPSFKIEFEKSEDQYKINQSIAISGNAETYAGAKVSNALLKYRVVRTATYPYWSPYRSFYPPANQKEISNGSISTNENGGFSFTFLAQADPSIKSKWNPVYNYEVFLDLTNLNGETQSSSKTIKIGQQALFLNGNIRDNIQLQDLKKLIISAKNINGENQMVSAQLSLRKLKTPAVPKKQKLWPKTDQNILTKGEFADKFPLYPNNHQQSINDFPVDYEVSNALVNCNQNIDLFREIEAGAYEIVATAKDQYGAEVVWKTRFVLFDENAKEPAYPMFSSVQELNEKVEVGDTASFLISSSLSEVQILYEISLKNSIIRKEWLVLDEEQKKINIPIKEEYRGGLSVHFTAIHSDRMIYYHKHIKVPYSNKKLNLSLGTYRDKIAPNSKEKWTLTISGQKGDATVAEVLAGMYDQSLDQFVKRNWSLDLYRTNPIRMMWVYNESFHSMSSTSFSKQRIEYASTPLRLYPQLNWFGFYLNPGRRTFYNKSMPMAAQSLGEMGEMEVADAVVMADFADGEPIAKENGLPFRDDPKPEINPIRKDFRETVFFYPQLSTNEKGETSFEFTMPEALTQWKFRALAHTKDLRIGTIETSIQTQKKLMVAPNAPRFFREGDELFFKAIVSNLSSQRLNGFAKLKFFNTKTGELIDIFSEQSADLPFELFEGKNAVLAWKIKIPKNIEAISYQLIAKTDEFSDGEEKIIPVLSNRMLVTESLPLWIRGNDSRQFYFDKLISSEKNKTIDSESFTLEFATNPAWYAIQALPTLSDNGNECSEQVFSRLYANSLANLIANQHPRIKEVFEQWRVNNSDELLSKLMQNPELKSILIEETPWLQKAKSESEQKQRIALLFDYNRMAREKEKAIDKLIELQLPNGGWAWFKGMRDNRYITQYIVEGLGHLSKLGVEFQSNQKLQKMLAKAVAYLDYKIQEDYDKLVSRKVDMSKDHLGHIQLHYLYTRSFFQDLTAFKKMDAFHFYLKQAQEFWLNRSLHNKALIALAVSRFKDKSPLPQQIQLSLTDNAIVSSEMGMHWKENTHGYYWHQSAIETQALIIEMYQELNASEKITDELKVWLLKQKQTQAWSSSKATASACYALLMDNVKLLTSDSKVSIQVASKTIRLPNENSTPGTGYYKKYWSKNELSAELGNISIAKESKGIAWGAAYWQYYQDIDKITSANESGLKINKVLFKAFITDRGEVMKPIDASEIAVGDKIKVRLRLESDRDLEFVHLKDYRAAAFEPLNTISRYKYQDGLGYYENTKDASTNFFIDWLPKGVYVFEYELRATVEGDFSSGISSIQCQYAPEFSAHSNGRRVKIIAQ